MPVIAVSNYSSYPRGYILGILDTDADLTQNESLEKWLESGGSIGDWKRPFTHVEITDKTKEEIEYLLEPFVVGDNADGRKYSLVAPSDDSAEHSILYNTGKISVTFAELQPFINERTE